MSDLPPLLTVWTADHDRRLKNLISRDYRYRRAGKTDWHDYCLKQMANLKAYGMETLPGDEKPEDYPVAFASPSDHTATTTTTATKGNKKTSIYGPKPKVGAVLVANGGAGAPPAPAPPATTTNPHIRWTDAEFHSYVGSRLFIRLPGVAGCCDALDTEDAIRHPLAPMTEADLKLNRHRLRSIAKIRREHPPPEPEESDDEAPAPAPRVPTPPPAEPSEDEDEEEDEDEDEDEEEEEREHDTASYASEHSVAEEPVADAPANGGAGAPPTTKPKSTRKCSKCSKPGHQARTCPN
jgi:hypothetical protein